MKQFLWLLIFFHSFISAQQLAPLTVEKIMRDPQWIGSSPSDVFWSPNSQRVYFQWNPDVAPDGKTLAFLHSTSNHPEELYLQANTTKAKEFLNYLKKI